MDSTLVPMLSLLLPLGGFALWPLFTADPEDSIIAPYIDPMSSLELRKQAAYAALKEAEFDRRTGKLSDEDYDKVVARYKGQALEAIAALEKQAPAGQKAGPRKTHGKAGFCAQCGTAIASGAKFCAGCGKPLRT